MSDPIHGTTIISVRRGNRVALGGDGQVTLGNVVLKAGARKVRRRGGAERPADLHVGRAPGPQYRGQAFGKHVVA